MFSKLVVDKLQLGLNEPIYTLARGAKTETDTSLRLIVGELESDTVIEDSNSPIIITYDETKNPTTRLTFNSNVIFNKSISVSDGGINGSAIASNSFNGTSILNGTVTGSKIVKNTEINAKIIQNGDSDSTETTSRYFERKERTTSRVETTVKNNALMSESKFNVDDIDVTFYRLETEGDTEANKKLSLYTDSLKNSKFSYCVEKVGKNYYFTDYEPIIAALVGEVRTLKTFIFKTQQKDFERLYKNFTSSHTSSQVTSLLKSLVNYFSSSTTYTKENLNSLISTYTNSHSTTENASMYSDLIDIIDKFGS